MIAPATATRREVMDRETTWQTLLDAGLVAGATPPAVAVPGAPASPWYVRLLLGFSGWLAALFMLGFVAAGFSRVFESEVASIVTGIIMMGVAWILLRVRQSENGGARGIGVHDFTAQFGLAISFSGQALFAFGVFQWFGSEEGDTASWLVMVVAQLALAMAMPNSIHRLWSAFAAAIAFYMALHSTALVFLPPAVILAVSAWAWLTEFRRPHRGMVLRPLAYGAVLALVVMDMATGIFGAVVGLDVNPPGRSLLAPSVESWLGQLLLGATLLWVVWRLLREGHGAVPKRLASAALIGVAVLVLVSFKAPGISIGVCILLLGFAHGNRILTGLGIAALLLYVSTYYYTLDETLLVKSQTLALTGAILLLLRWGMDRWLLPQSGHKSAPMAGSEAGPGADSGADSGEGHG